MRPSRLVPRFPTLFSLVLLTLLVLPGLASAIGTFVPAPQRADIAYDDLRNVLYISSGAEVLRYDVATGTFLTPITLGGDLKGMVLSDDHSTLYVADQSYSATQLWVHRINLTTLATSPLNFPRAADEGGSFSVALGGGKLFVTTSSLVSGSVPMHSFDMNMGLIYNLTSVRGNTVLRASTNDVLVGLVEPDTADGRFGRFFVCSGVFCGPDTPLIKQGADGTGAANWDVGGRVVGGDMSTAQFAIVSAAGTFITDYNLVKNPLVIGQGAANKPIGVVYHPLRSRMFFPIGGTSLVEAYDTNTLAPVAQYDFESVFPATGSPTYASGRMSISDNGKMLFATVDGGVRFVVFPDEPPHANLAGYNVPEEQARSITLSGFDPEGQPVTYTVTRQPLHGTLTGTPPNVVYTSHLNYNGNDSFGFVTHDATQTSEEANVSVSVYGVNDAPSSTYTKANPLPATRNVAVSLTGAFASISAGPANEASQVVSFQVTTSNPNLFSVLPAVSSTGTLTFKTKSKGSATVTVTTRDNGGTANGGVDASAPFSFVINSN
jgi:hypothetical protein